MGHSLIGLYPWNLHGWFDWDLFHLAKRNDPSAVPIRDRSKMAQRWEKWIWDQDGFQGLDRWHLHVTHLSETDETEYHLCWGLSSHWFPVVRDGHHPTSTGVYTTTMRIPYLRWDDHPQYKELFEPGTYQYDHTESQMK